VNPYLIIGLLIGWLASLAGVGWWQNKAGHVAERTVWQARENAELRTANDKIKAMQDSARRDEQAHALALNAVSTNYEKELSDASKLRAADIAAIRAGTLRLRDQYPASIYSLGNRSAETGPGPGGRDGPQGAELPAATSEFLLALASDADDVTRQLTACQQVIIEDRKTQ
jgi:cation transport regulator ChaB